MITNAGDKVNGGSERKRAEDGKSQPATYIIIYRMPQVRDSSAFGEEAGEWREAGRSVRNKGKMARKEKHEKRGKKCLTRGMVCGILRKLSARAAENSLLKRVERENKSKKI